eukprot:365121-Alexandrium_andersonii.AAC.1
MSASLVGSEMCIRDRLRLCTSRPLSRVPAWDRQHPDTGVLEEARLCVACLLYTSDAADDM